jgi:hypothetical protein
MTTEIEEKVEETKTEEAQVEAPAAVEPKQEDYERVFFNRFDLMVRAGEGGLVFTKRVWSDETFSELVARVANRGRKFISFPKTLGGGTIEVDGFMVDTIPYFGVRADEIVAFEVVVPEDEDDDELELDDDEVSPETEDKVRVLPKDFLKK